MLSSVDAMVGNLPTVNKEGHPSSTGAKQVARERQKMVVLSEILLTVRPFCLHCLLRPLPNGVGDHGFGNVNGLPQHPFPIPHEATIDGIPQDGTDVGYIPLLSLD